ncbi:IS4 family transposase [Ktedonospora formicarum]|uniref:IS4 family transposase n=1 Tax=Ktedonospora formicarum TaxID=2778364 RepID=A0A8J3I3H8_9CHLR|nr:IS4 family transposase [Ktedonospora formicarum]GHO48629.1 IS4 family transposase [Ktedonospora formicarum]
MYRWLHEPDVTFEALVQPHQQQTRERMQAERVVLAVQDTTEIDLSHRGKMAGIGQIGNAKGRGFHLQTVLAVQPETRAVLGCLAQKPFVRLPAPKNEQRYQRRHREQRETDVWMQMIEHVGPSAADGLLVHVGDRGADMFPFFRACVSTQTHFVVRAAHNRRVEAQEEELGHLLDRVRAWSNQDQRPFAVPASHGRAGRETTLQISFGQVSILPPCNDPRGSKDPLPLWVVRVWEPEPPESVEPLEWILLTSMPIHADEQAWERVAWYRCRWIVEEYHQCLKTGCRIEERQMQSADRLMRLLGLFSAVAVRLLQLRTFSQQTPDRPASEVVEVQAVAIIATRTAQSPSMLTGKAFWIEVARMGGYLARAGDGPPGWKTLWKGWLQVQTLLEGVHLASHLSL